MNSRFSSLDGWRGIAILFVLAGHLLPLGPKVWEMNAAIATTGMVIFFNLSGFLITNILLRDQNVMPFLIRRLMRIVPLAWLVLCVTLFGIAAKWELYLPHLFFYANWEPMAVSGPTSHFWSLCVEMQFYFAIAALVLIFKKKAFYILPLLCVAITLYRWHNNVGIAINTYYRVDEILAGCILSLLYNGSKEFVRRFFCSLNPIIMFLLLLVSAHPLGGFFMYLRPYISMIMIGSTLFNEQVSWLGRLLKSRFLFYIASISYALYVIHGGLRYTWLAEGDTMVRYLKRPLFFVTTFLLAHISTFYYEKKWIDFGKKITAHFVSPTK